MRQLESEFDELKVDGLKEDCITENINEKADSDELTRLMLDACPLCCQIWDKNMNIVDCNEAGVKLYGFKNKREYMERFFECSPEYQPDRQPSAEAAVKYVQEAHESGYMQFDWMHRRPDSGTPIPAEVTLVRVLYKGEYAIAGYTRDLREIKQAEQALANAEQLTRAIMDFSPVSYVLFNKDLQIVDCNRTALWTFGCHEGKKYFLENYWKIYTPEKQPDGQNSLAKAKAVVKNINTGEYDSFEWMHRTHGGEPLPMQNTMAQFTYNGEKFTVSFKYDLRKIKEMEKAALEAERALYKAELGKVRAEAETEIFVNSIKYASRIQKTLLPDEAAFKEIFTDYSIIWEPRDIVGGDIYWLKKFDAGSVLCICDCTGHGTPGALLTMLAVSTLETEVTPGICHDPAEIIWQFEQIMSSVLNSGMRGDCITDIKDGCDIAVLFIDNNKNISFSAGNISLFVCDGKEARRIKGQRMFVGEGRLKSKEEIETTGIPANPENKFYLSSDGLFSQPGGKYSRPFGYRDFKQIITENHAGMQSDISGKIYAAYEKHRGAQAKVDDFMLISFKP